MSRSFSMLLCATLTVGLSATACQTVHQDDAGHVSQVDQHQAMAPAEPAPKQADVKPAKKPQTVKASAPDGMVISEIMLPTGSRDSSVLMVEKLAPAEVAVNQPFEYKLVVTNLTSEQLGGVMINDAFPQGFNIQKTIPEFPSSDISSGRWVLGNLDANEQRTITIVGSATAPGVISSCTQASYDRSMCLTTSVVQPGIQLDLLAPAEVLVCDDIVVSYKVCNPGSGTATNVKVTAAYPQGLVDAKGGKSLTRTFAKLAPGQCEDIEVVLHAEKRGSFTHSGAAKADANLSSNARNMTTVVRQPELKIECDKTPDIYVGRQGKGIITVTNVGDAVSADTVLSARLSKELGFVRATNGGASSDKTPGVVTWNLGDLAPGKSVKVEMMMRSQSIGTALVSARAEGVCAPEVTCSSSAVVKGIPAVLLEVIDEHDPVVVGETEVYTITATNQGSAPDRNLRIVATLPQNVEFVSAKGPTKGTLQGNRVTFGSLASLADGEEAVWKITVKSVRAANARFKVTMHTDNLGSTPVEETEATNYYE